jgi:GNAT superfamily N-acetyltransferase
MANLSASVSIAHRGHAMLTIRPAEPRDADAAADLLRRSITELCATDHQNDAATLAQWLANKTPEQVRVMLARPQSLHIVAEEHQRLLGVGAIARDGHIRLLYLLPGAQRRGIGTAIFRALELQAQHWGLSKLTAVSNTDACAFYARMGFQPAGDAQPFLGKARGWPYEKMLSVNRQGNTEQVLRQAHDER